MSFFESVTLLILILVQANLSIILIPLFIVVSSVCIVNTAGFSLAMQKQGKNAGSASALLGVVSFAFGGITSTLVGIVGEESTVPMGLVIIMSSMSAVIAYITFVLRKKYTKRRLIEQSKMIVNKFAFSWQFTLLNKLFSL